ncbi:MAG TPA: hypothetical protein PKV71_20345, partial [Calditrichia bacterium]|nr:hypothetical protein [Calditrichia bacterium]
MRTWYVLFILIFTLGTTLVGQTIFSESFDNGVPPANWTIDGFPTSWLSSNSAFAGGSAPEVRFAGSVNSFVGTSRLISPTMDMTGISGMIVEFKYQVDHNFPPYKIGVATRSGNGPWNIVWDASPTASGSDYVVFPVVNSDMGNSNFQICWYFSGDTENIID